MLLKLPTTTDLQDGQLANQLYCIPAKRIQRHSSAYQTHDKPQLLCGDAVRVYRRQQVTMPSGPFKPAFGGKILPVGCSDKTPRSHYGKEGKAEGPVRGLCAALHGHNTVSCNSTVCAAHELDLPVLFNSTPAYPCLYQHPTSHSGKM